LILFCTASPDRDLRRCRDLVTSLRLITQKVWRIYFIASNQIVKHLRNHQMITDYSAKSGWLPASKAVSSSHRLATDTQKLKKPLLTVVGYFRTAWELLWSPNQAESPTKTGDSLVPYLNNFVADRTGSWRLVQNIRE
jgi:hypothetical protein